MKDIKSVERYWEFRNSLIQISGNKSKRNRLLSATGAFQSTLSSRPCKQDYEGVRMIARYHLILNKTVFDKQGLKYNKQRR